MTDEERAGGSGLSILQSRAVELLLDGCSNIETARQIGVDVSTLYRWRTQDNAFRAEVNRRLKQVEREADLRMTVLTNSSVDVLLFALREKKDARVALALLKGRGALNGKLPPIGSDDPEVIKFNESFWAEQDAAMRADFTQLRNLNRARLGLVQESTEDVPEGGSASDKPPEAPKRKKRRRNRHGHPGNGT